MLLSRSGNHIPFNSVKVGRLVKSVKIIQKSYKKCYYKDYFIIIIIIL